MGFPVWENNYEPHVVCVSGCSSPSPAREVGGRLSEGKQVGLLTGSGAGPDPGMEGREAAAVMGRGASPRAAGLRKTRPAPRAKEVPLLDGGLVVRGLVGFPTTSLGDAELY